MRVQATRREVLGGTNPLAVLPARREFLGGAILVSTQQVKAAIGLA